MSDENEGKMPFGLYRGWNISDTPFMELYGAINQKTYRLTVEQVEEIVNEIRFRQALLYQGQFSTKGIIL